MMNPDTENTDSIDQGFFGHPKGLRTLFFTELWERMSYYGMRGLLVLYMTVGVTGNPGLDWSNAEANAIYGIYAGMVYFLALPGGWLADNLLGYQRAVLFGALIIMLGHFTLAIPLEQTFILGLILVAAGTGLLKPNISSIVGQLYSTNDDRRDSGFTIFLYVYQYRKHAWFCSLRMVRGKSRMALGIWCSWIWNASRCNPIYLF